MTTFRLGDTGPQIDLMQSALKKLGFYNGKIDGIFGKELEDAVKKFQKEYGLVVDGIIGPATLDKLFPYINGYSLYRVEPNDTFYTIANKFDTSVNLIIASNPTIDPSNLKVGTILVVPVFDIVHTDIRYTSSVMQANVIALGIVYPFVETGIIGTSKLSVDIPYIRIGKGEKKVLYSASIHGNDWITSTLLMKFAENYCKSLVTRQPIYGYDPMTVFDMVSIYIVPMVNPDGVDLVTGYIKPGNEIYTAAKNAAARYPHIPFPSGWKANISGVDLDLQFPAGWTNAKNINASKGFTNPGPTNFPGYGPLTELESLALYNFTLAYDFRLILSYQTEGNTIFWKFNTIIPPNGESIGRKLSALSGYSLVDNPLEYSYATYKDWFIQNYNKPRICYECRKRSEAYWYKSVRANL